MKTTKQFPKELYVTVEGEDPETWLAAHKTSEGIEEGAKVAIYRLVEVKTQRVTQELV